MYQVGGFQTFWLGNVAGVIRSFPHSGLKFSCYHVLSGHFLPDSSSIYRTRFLLGALSGAVASVLLYPLDILKSKVTLFKFTNLANHSQIPPLAYIAAAKELWESGGITRTTRGLGISVVGSALHNGFLFMGYYSIKSWWVPVPKDSIYPYVVAGVMAGAFAQVTYPLDLIRRTALHQNLHAYDAVQMLVREGGLLGLYRGSVANLLKVAPLFGLQFLLYEMMMGSDLVDQFLD
jgi:hypothetical protein